MNSDDENVTYTLTYTTDTGFDIDYVIDREVYRQIHRHGWAVIDVKEEKDEWKEVTNLLESPL